MFRGITGRGSVPRGFTKTFLSHLQLSRSYGKGMPEFTVDSLNPALLNVQYAVRGELAIKAEKYRVQLKSGEGVGLPFNRVISSNIGNPQQAGLDQPPITFIRQVGCLSFDARCAGSSSMCGADSGVDGMASTC